MILLRVARKLYCLSIYFSLFPSQMRFCGRMVSALCFCPSAEGPTSGGVVALKTSRREVPGSNPGRAYRPRRSEFSVVFCETRVNTARIHQKDPHSTYRPRSLVRQSALTPTTNQPTILPLSNFLPHIFQHTAC